MRFAFAGEHLAAAGPGIVANLLRLRAEMRFGIERAIGWRQAHAGLCNQPQTTPFAVALDAKYLGYRLLGHHISTVGDDTAVLIFYCTLGCYFLLNQHVDALQ